MIATALLMIVGAMALVRIGWDGRRSIAVLGWALAAVALMMLASRDGAWGLAMGGVAGIATAFAMLAYAGWTSPAKVRRPARDAPTIVLPRRWSGIGRRVAVFVLVVPVAFAAAQWAAFGVQAMMRRHGAVEVDAIVLALFLQPLLWGVVMAVQMMRAGPMRMIAPPLSVAMVGTLLWSLA